MPLHVGEWDDDELGDDVPLSEVLEPLIVRLNVLRCYHEWSQRKLRGLSQRDADTQSTAGTAVLTRRGDGSSSSSNSSRSSSRDGSSNHADRDTGVRREVQEWMEVVAALEDRFGTLPKPFHSRQVVPLLNPSVFSSVMRVLGRCREGTPDRHRRGRRRGSTKIDSSQGDGDIDAEAVRRHVAKVAMQVLCFLPEVGRGDVLADALLYGQARECPSRRAAADCGVLLVPHESEGRWWLDHDSDDNTDDGEEEEETKDNGEKVKGEEGAIPQQCLRRRRERMAERYGAILVQYHSDAYMEKLKRGFLSLSFYGVVTATPSWTTPTTTPQAAGDIVFDNAGVTIWRTVFTALRTVLCLPSVREAFALWHASSTGPSSEATQHREGGVGGGKEPNALPGLLLPAMFPLELMWGGGLESSRASGRGGSRSQSRASSRTTSPTAGRRARTKSAGNRGGHPNSSGNNESSNSGSVSTDITKELTCDGSRRTEATNALVVAMAWEALLAVLPDPVLPETWSRPTLVMLLRCFDPLMHLLTCTQPPPLRGGSPRPGTPLMATGAPASTAEAQLSERNPTAELYALTCLSRLVSVAEAVGPGEVWQAPHGGHPSEVLVGRIAACGSSCGAPSGAQGIDSLFAQRVLTSPALACFCLNTLAHAAREAPTRPDNAAIICLVLGEADRTVARATRGGCASAYLACTILDALASRAAAEVADEGGSLPAPTPSTLVLRYLLVTNREAVRATLDALGEQRFRDAGTNEESGGEKGPGGAPSRRHGEERGLWPKEATLQASLEALPPLTEAEHEVLAAWV